MVNYIISNKNKDSQINRLQHFFFFLLGYILQISWNWRISKETFSLRLYSRLAWDKEKSQGYSPGIKNNIGVTFWRGESLPLLAISLPFCPRLQMSTETYTESPLGFWVSSRLGVEPVERKFLGKESSANMEASVIEKLTMSICSGFSKNLGYCSHSEILVNTMTMDI